MADEFRIPVTKFVQDLAKTRDEIWTRFLLQTYKQQALTKSEWREIITALWSK